jgi:hypothetical protein
MNKNRINNTNQCRQIKTAAILSGAITCAENSCSFRLSV